MNKLEGLLLATCVAMAMAVSPVLAQQGQPQSPTDHSAHHGGADQRADQPVGGMMGEGGQGQGMMGKGMMGNDQGQGMMRQGDMMGRGMMDKKSSGCPMMGGMGQDKKGNGHGMMHSRPMMEARLAYIKTDLEITEAQTAAWDAYADAVRARHTSMESMHADMMKAKEDGSAVERMDARIKATEAKLESLKALKPKMESLYSVLADEQKEKADKVLGGGCGMM